MDLLIKDRLAALQRIIDAGTTRDDSLFGGNLGLVLYWWEWYRNTGNSKYAKKASQLLALVIKRLNDGTSNLTGSSLSRGGAGLALVLLLLEKEGMISSSNKQAINALNQLLYDEAALQLDEDCTDYLHGAFGIIHYFTSYTRQTGDNFYLNELLMKACSRVVKQPDGYWFRNAMLSHKGQEPVNFSLAHGQSGMLLVLIAAHALTKHSDITEEVIRRGIQYILNHRMPVDDQRGEYSCFPFSASEDGAILENRPRLGWCYGDLNEVLLLYRAGQLFNEPEWIRIADSTGLYSTTRKEEATTQVLDPIFCHGASGLAQFYHTLYVELGNEKYKEAQTYWLGQTIRFIQDTAVCNAFYHTAHSMLEGPVGVSLVLLGCMAAQKPFWSEVLFL
jgi:lantibiotic biosynthesis protein